MISFSNFHFNFRQFYLSFSYTELVQFKKYIKKIDANYWESLLNKFQLKRRIPIPTEQNSLYLMLNKFEFDKLTDLLGLKKRKVTPYLLSSKDIEYSTCNN